MANEHPRTDDWGFPVDEPTQQLPAVDGSRQLSSGQPTQQFPRDEPTQQLPTVDATQELPAVDANPQQPAGGSSQLDGFGQTQQPLSFEAPAPHESAQATSDPANPGGWLPPSGQPWQGQQAPWAPPSNATPASTKTTSRRLSGTRKAGIAALAVALIGSGALLQGPVTTLAGDLLPGTSTSQPAQPSSGGADPDEDPWGQSNPDPTDPSQPGQQLPDPQTPWPGSGFPDQGTNGRSESPTTTGTTRGQTTATSSQQTGVVLIESRTTNGEGAGTGMVLTTNGYVLTNYHVVQSSTSIEVTVATTKKTYTATVVGHDASQDVALLKLADAEGLATVSLDDDSDLAVGSTVTAVGNSEGQGYLSAATGAVTDLSSSITVSNEASASGSEQLDDVIETTAAAVPGDSGGPLLDAEGEVVAMTTAGESRRVGRRSTQAVTVASYGVPIDRAIEVVDQIEAGDESGTVTIGKKSYLGVSVQSASGSELVVSSVVSGQAAAKAGLTAGDQITALDRTPISTHAQLAAALAEHEPGDRVELSWVDRTGRTQTGTATLGESPVN